MNLIELYEQTPVERHRDIIVLGDRVLVKDIGGNISQYFIAGDGELWPAYPDKELKADIAAIRNKLGL